MVSIIRRLTTCPSAVQRETGILRSWMTKGIKKKIYYLPTNTFWPSFSLHLFVGQSSPFCIMKICIRKVRWRELLIFATFIGRFIIIIISLLTRKYAEELVLLQALEKKKIAMKASSIDDSSQGATSSTFAKNSNVTAHSFFFPWKDGQGINEPLFLYQLTPTAHANKQINNGTGLAGIHVAVAANSDGSAGIKTFAEHLRTLILWKWVTPLKKRIERPLRSTHDES